jgi:hypothetical protein
LNKSFTILLSQLTAVIVGIVLILQFTTPLIFPHTWVMIAYFFGITLLSHSIMEKGTASKDPIDSYNATMGATAVRLFLSLAVVVIYIYLFKENKYNFAFTFFILYFLFTAFEIRTLLSKLRQN